MNQSSTTSAGKCVSVAILKLALCRCHSSVSHGSLSFSFIIPRELNSAATSPADKADKKGAVVTGESLGLMGDTDQRQSEDDTG